MERFSQPPLRHARAKAWALRFVLGGLGVFLINSSSAVAQPAAPAPRGAVTGSVGSGPAWSDLTAEQRASLDLIGGVPQQDVAASRERLQQLRR